MRKKKRAKNQASKHRKVPVELRPGTARWVQEVRREWELESHQEKVLLAAAEAWDRRQQAREALSREGLTYKNKHGDIKPHPGIAIERDSRLAFVRCIRELNLDVAPPESRPPALKYSGGKNA